MKIIIHNDLKDKLSESDISDMINGKRINGIAVSITDDTVVIEPEGLCNLTGSFGSETDYYLYKYEE